MYCYHQSVRPLDGPLCILSFLIGTLKYDKIAKQGKAAFNERNHHTTQQQGQAIGSLGVPQTKTGQGIHMAERTG
jgi:hypothetical protein